MHLPIQTIAVIGAGTMGQGIAQVCATAGFKTLVYDARADALKEGISKLQSSLQALVDKDRMLPAQQSRVINAIQPVASLTEVKADLIIEAVIEDLAVKQKLFRDLEAINDGLAILATNTSSLSIAAIGSELRNSANFLGIHFFNPAPVMKLVEIVSGKDTAPEITGAASEFIASLGKTLVHCADTPGFIVNRVARHFYLESLRVLEEGGSDVIAIDSLMRSAGFKMGPFELMDLIGIDINYAVSQSVFTAFDHAIRFTPSPIQKEKVDTGKLGRKTGEGFYPYIKKAQG